MKGTPFFFCYYLYLKGTKSEEAICWADLFPRLRKGLGPGAALLLQVKYGVQRRHY
jgi:hypothetical protein